MCGMVLVSGMATLTPISRNALASGYVEVPIGASSRSYWVNKNEFDFDSSVSDYVGRVAIRNRVLTHGG